jgi:Tfp pilus assembly protein PilX
MKRQGPEQAGMALVVGLILLALMTVMAITGFNIGRTSMDIVGNMQSRQDVIAAANNAIQEALSTPRLFQAPDAIFLQPCENKPNTRCYDTNGDDVDDIRVELAPTPTCIMAQTIPNANLDIDDADQKKCLTGPGTSGYVEGTSSGSSVCANSVWEITAVATDLITEAEVSVTQGAAVRVHTDDIATRCPE